MRRNTQYPVLPGRIELSCESRIRTTLKVEHRPSCVWILGQWCPTRRVGTEAGCPHLERVAGKVDSRKRQRRAILDYGVAKRTESLEINNTAIRGRLRPCASEVAGKGQNCERDDQGRQL